MMADATWVPNEAIRPYGTISTAHRDWDCVRPLMEKLQ